MRKWCWRQYTASLWVVAARGGGVALCAHDCARVLWIALVLLWVREEGSSWCLCGEGISGWMRGKEASHHTCWGSDPRPHGLGAAGPKSVSVSLGLHSDCEDEVDTSAAVCITVLEAVSAKAQ